MPVWPLPPLPLLCHLTRALPLIFSFSSTFTLCLIALDRHHLIVDDGQVRPNYKLVSKPVKTKMFSQYPGLSSPGGWWPARCWLHGCHHCWCLGACSPLCKPCDGSHTPEGKVQGWQVCITDCKTEPDSVCLFWIMLYMMQWKWMYTWRGLVIYISRIFLHTMNLVNLQTNLSHALPLYQFLKLIYSFHYSPDFVPGGEAEWNLCSNSRNREQVWPPFLIQCLIRSFLSGKQQPGNFSLILSWEKYAWPLSRSQHFRNSISLEAIFRIVVIENFIFSFTMISMDPARRGCQLVKWGIG